MSYPINHNILAEDFKEYRAGRAGISTDQAEWLFASLNTMCEAYDNLVDTKEVFLVWDHGREIKGEAPELLSVQATEDDAIAYGKQTFESDEQHDCIIECWVTGTDTTKDAFRLSDKG